MVGHKPLLVVESSRQMATVSELTKKQPMTMPTIRDTRHIANTVCLGMGLLPSRSPCLVSSNVVMAWSFLCLRLHPRYHRRPRSQLLLASWAFLLGLHWDVDLNRRTFREGNRGNQIADAVDDMEAAQDILIAIVAVG